MGFKRPFDEEEFQEFSFKHPKQHDTANKLTSLGENCSPNEASKKSDNTDLADKEFENSAPSSWGSSTTSEEDAGSGTAFCPSFTPEYFEFNFPRRTFIQLGDAYSSLLNSSPRREVPLGPDYQADVPVWEPGVVKKHPVDGGDVAGDDNEEQMMGVCVISMPNLNSSAYDGVKAGDGRRDCSCLDQGSVRCVRQHVKEAREKLRETIGCEIFANLGFSGMGEEVAHNWTEKEERLFHEVVYFNPMALHRKFWEQLALMFPSRTKRELVSYYFNVFMLQRRAVQNRSNLLEIDSDNDEWQGNDGSSFVVGGEDEDSAVESLVDQDVWVTHNESPDESGYDDEDEYADDDNDDSNCDEEAGVAGTIEGNRESGQVSRAQIEKLPDKGKLDLKLHHMDNIPGGIMGDYSIVEEDWHMSSTDSHGPNGASDAIQVSGSNNDHKTCLRGKNFGSDDGFCTGYLLEPCDAKVWDSTYSMGLLKGVDLLPTCNIIEEIFGPCTWDNKSSNSKH
ncbi:unnamed protein product [Ilex paraguariensis]|uniref:Myb-like domain-containing protein n=1 Tax=Ilex paraguariensis TaxID=185542 RepID=A0ABC8RBQ2_9AQUA